MSKEKGTRRDHEEPTSGRSRGFGVRGQEPAGHGLVHVGKEFVASPARLRPGMPFLDAPQQHPGIHIAYKDLDLYEKTISETEYSRLPVPQEELMRVVDSSAYLTRLSTRNMQSAFSLAYVRAVVGRVMPGKRHVYYPGIGGGDEAVDALSAFEVLDADTVIGVDLQTAKNPNKIRVDRAFERASTMVERLGITDITANASMATFTLDGKPRRLQVEKGDAETFLPGEPLQRIIYQRRMTSLINLFPKQVMDQARVIFAQDEDEHFTRRAAKFCLVDHGFYAVDLMNIPEANPSTDVTRKVPFWNRNNQLLIRGN